MTALPVGGHGAHAALTDDDYDHHDRGGRDDWDGRDLRDGSMGDR